MATITNSGQFNRFWIADYLGTLQEVTAFMQSVDYTLQNEDADVSTFAAGGGNMTETHVHGAQNATIKGTFLFDDTFNQIIAQCVGSRTGFTVQGYAGTNAIPTLGDELFRATVTLLSIPVSYKPGATATQQLQFDLVDGGAIAPNFYSA